MNEPYRLRHANRIVGAFLLISLVLLVVMSFVLLRTGDFLVQKYDYWIEIDQNEIADLPRGAAVMILGRYAGQVNAIDYVQDSTLVRIEIQVDADMSDEIRNDSVVTVARKFGVGAPMLSIRRRADHSGDRTPLPPGSQIKGFIGAPDRLEQMAQEVADVSDSVVEIRSTLIPTLESIRSTSRAMDSSLANNANPALGRAESAFDSLTTTSETLRPEARETMGTLRRSVERLEQDLSELTELISKVVREDVSETLSSLQDTSRETQQAARAIRTTTERTYDNLDTTLESIRSAATQVEILARESRQITDVLRAEASELPGTTARANDTLDEAQDLVGEVRSHWLLRRYNNASESSTQVSPSRIRGGAR